MAHVRRDVWNLGSGWSDALLWYARGVGVLQQRPITDHTSWRFLAAIHGIDVPLWQDAGYLRRGDKLPSQEDQDLYWNQCQHQSWYFLPWHRGYVASFEQIVRTAIVGLGGPKDWSLPYWNYNDNRQTLKMPACFAAASLPNGEQNPLYVQRRFGPNGDGVIVLDEARIDLRPALKEHHFAGSSSGGTPGFGGPESIFAHYGDVNGLLEQQPHNYVHVAVGGRARGNPNLRGLMINPNTAALDPIFWLHHANIDRLWDVWLKRDPNDQNPVSAAWVAGPPTGGRGFSVPTTNGGRWSFRVGDMLDTRAPKLDYVYEDTSDPLHGTRAFQQRLETLGVAPQVPGAVAAKEKTLSKPVTAELIGANDQAIDLNSTTVETPVLLDRAASAKVFGNLKTRAFSATATPADLDRVFLNLENIRGDNDAATYDVYISLPVEGQPSAHPDVRAGSISLFGVSNASRTDNQHGGKGLSHVLEITDIFDKLSASGAPDLTKLTVRFVAATEILPGDNISVGRVSVYRQGR
ncbi:tyrosinase family protein [Pseudomonas sp. NPDC087697]|uniref:tyrosinase family protein n=1 Tax=Pseudomonas sp. NPDC087697 TaxID=3364447 RepID=UPI0037F80716